MLSHVQLCDIASVWPRISNKGTRMDRKRIQGAWFKMAEEKDMSSPPPARTLKLQLAVEEPSTEGCGNSPKKDIPHPKTK